MCPQAFHAVCNDQRLFNVGELGVGISALLLQQRRGGAGFNVHQ